MLIFAKDIRQRGYRHPAEDSDPELAAYMDYQRKLYPYTVIRGGLDFAYKELDDMLQYIDNGYRKPEGSQRLDYPEDIHGWFKNRFPWTGAFMTMEDMHGLLVRLIKSMDDFRSQELPNTWHLAVLYDTSHNIIQFYNEVLRTDFNLARDIRLSQNIEVHFDDFINNYWPHLEFMLLSRPDFPHERLLRRHEAIEEFIHGLIADGEPPLQALESAAARFRFHSGTLELLRRDPISPRLARLESVPLEEDRYAHLKEILPPSSEYAGWTRLDVDYLESQRLCSFLAH